jgi:hypothetical protein
MRRVVSVLLSVAAVVAAVVVAVGFARSSPGTAQHLSARGVPPPTLPGSVNVVRYQRAGTEAFCRDGSCGAGGSSGSNLEFSLPASSVPYRSTLTISFRYQATGKDAAFTVRGTVDGPGHLVATAPATRPLGPTGGAFESATMVFRPALLVGGVTYTFSVAADISRHVGNARIGVSNVVYSLQAWIAD